MDLFVGVLRETLASSQVLFLHVDNPGLHPDFDVLVSRVENVNVHVVRTAAVGTFFVDPDQFFKNVTAERSVVI